MAPLSAPKMDHPLRPALHSIRIRVLQSLIPGGAGGGCGASDPNDPRQNVTRSNNVMATAAILSADGCKREDQEKTDEERGGTLAPRQTSSRVTLILIGCLMLSVTSCRRWRLLCESGPWLIPPIPHQIRIGNYACRRGCSNKMGLGLSSERAPLGRGNHTTVPQAFSAEDPWVQY